MDAQSSKGQRFTGLCVDQQDFGVQDHTVASRERLGDVVLKVGHLEHRRPALGTEHQHSCFKSCIVPLRCLKNDDLMFPIAFFMSTDFFKRR